MLCVINGQFCCSADVCRRLWIVLDLLMRSCLKLLVFLLSMVVAACGAVHPAKDNGGVMSMDADELADLKSDFDQAQLTLDGFLAQNEQGNIVGSISMGLFVSDLLSQFSSLDGPLSDYLHQDGHFIEGYLTDIFQNQPEREIQVIAAMDQPGNKMARQAAAAALDCLRHLPDTKESAEVQAKDRQDLALAMAHLKKVLIQLSLTLP